MFLGLNLIFLIVSVHAEDGLYLFTQFNALSALPSGDCEEKEFINQFVSDL